MEKYKLLFKTFFRKKKLIKYCIKFFVLIILGFLLILGIRDKLDLKLSNMKKEKINNFYILVSFKDSIDKEINDIKKINHVKKAYYFLSSVEGDYIYTYIDSNLYDIKSGRNINSDDEIITSDKEKISNINKLKVVGVYDIFNNFLNLPDNLIITSYNYMVEKSVNPITSLLVQVDNYTNVDEVSDIIDSKYDCETTVYNYDSDALSKYDLFINIVNIILKAFLILSFILFIIIGIAFIHDEKDDNLNLRVLGYSNRIICLSTLLKISSMFFLSLVISIVIAIVIMIIFNIYFAINIFNILNIVLLLYLVLLMSITTLICFNRKRRLIRD